MRLCFYFIFVAELWYLLYWVTNFSASSGYWFLLQCSMWELVIELCCSWHLPKFI